MTDPKHSEPARYFLDDDNDCHWYLVPEAIRAEWDAWLQIPSDDERAWEPPEGTKMIGVPLSLITFTDPKGI